MAASQRMVQEAFDRWVQHLSDAGYSHVETLYYSHGEFVHDAPVEFTAQDYCLYREEHGWRLYLTDGDAQYTLPGSGKRWRLARVTDEDVPSFFSTNTEAHAWFVAAVEGGA